MSNFVRNGMVVGGGMEKSEQVVAETRRSGYIISKPY
jgi:hypothetical protein